MGTWPTSRRALAGHAVVRGPVVAAHYAFAALLRPGRGLATELPGRQVPPGAARRYLADSWLVT